MDAVKFVQDYIRLCAQQEDCDTCPIHGIEGVDFCTAIPEERSLEGCEKLVTITNAWALAHPHKTRQSVFLEHYPNADLNEEGILKVCPNVVEGSNYVNLRNCGNIPCAVCYRAYWMQEVN